VQRSFIREDAVYDVQKCAIALTSHIYSNRVSKGSSFYCAAATVFRQHPVEHVPRDPVSTLERIFSRTLPYRMKFFFQSARCEVFCEGRMYRLGLTLHYAHHCMSFVFYSPYFAQKNCCISSSGFLFCNGLSMEGGRMAIKVHFSKFSRKTFFQAFLATQNAVVFISTPSTSAK
jgi:hypothetical protein